MLKRASLASGLWLNKSVFNGSLTVIEPNGGLLQKLETVVILKTPQSLKALSTIRLPYDATFQAIEIMEASSKTSLGKSEVARFLIFHAVK